MFSSTFCALSAPATAEQAAYARQPGAGRTQEQAAARRIADGLQLLASAVDLQRRIVRAGESIYHAGQPFSHLYILNSGIFKLSAVSAEGREQVVGLRFRGDWLGFAGIAKGCHACDAVAVDTGEVWAVSYDTLLAACVKNPALMVLLHEAMSGEIVRDRDSMTSVCTLPADARVADFLRSWAENLANRGLRDDQIRLCMTRAEIGNYLGLTLETVSRALSKLARMQLISFAQKGRREIGIPDVGQLAAFVRQSLSQPGRTLQ